eukprot:7399213-Pyramimonas_sp.AAC.1
MAQAPWACENLGASPAAATKAPQDEQRRRLTPDALTFNLTRPDGTPCPPPPPRPRHSWRIHNPVAQNVALAFCAADTRLT